MLVRHPRRHRPLVQSQRRRRRALMPITTIAELEAIYGEFGAVGEASTAKVADHVTPALPPLSRGRALRRLGDRRS